MIQSTIPSLVTFDGEARSGKGTIVQMTKDYLRDQCNQKVMLIDRGQTFRVLVVAARESGIDIDRPSEIDDFLADEQNIEDCTAFVREVYRMSKEERDALLYTNEVSEDSAKIGARAGSQLFVKNLTKKWLRSAGEDGFDIVLVDGRTLEAIAREMDSDGLCQYRLGLYFTCNAEVGARRTLGLATKLYRDLSESEKNDVDALVEQIVARNQRDFLRAVEPLAPPKDAHRYTLPEVPQSVAGDSPMLIIDTSADLTKSEMSNPVANLVAEQLQVVVKA